MLVILAAPAVLPRVPLGRRGLAGGLVFMDAGAGVAISGTLVPLLLRGGLSAAWFGMGALSLALTAVGWSGWPEDVQPDRAPASRALAPRSTVLRALYVA